MQSPPTKCSSEESLAWTVSSAHQSVPRLEFDPFSLIWQQQGWESYNPNKHPAINLLLPIAPSSKIENWTAILENDDYKNHVQEKQSRCVQWWWSNSLELIWWQGLEEIYRGGNLLPFFFLYSKRFLLYGCIFVNGCVFISSWKTVIAGSTSNLVSVQCTSKARFTCCT